MKLFIALLLSYVLFDISLVKGQEGTSGATGTQATGGSSPDYGSASTGTTPTNGTGEASKDDDHGIGGLGILALGGLGLAGVGMMMRNKKKKQQIQTAHPYAILPHGYPHPAVHPGHEYAYGAHAPHAYPHVPHKITIHQHLSPAHHESTHHESHHNSHSSHAHHA